jgi:hypothetical protein
MASCVQEKAFAQLKPMKIRDLFLSQDFSTEVADG